MKILYTSLAEIKSFSPCSSGWKAILKGRNKTEADDEPFPLKDCLLSNSFADVCWLIKGRKTELNICTVAAKKCADSVSHLKNYASAYAAASDAAASDAASAYADAASDADAADAAAAAADAASYAASYASYADTCRPWASSYAAAYASYASQVIKNKQFLFEAIELFESQN